MSSSVGKPLRKSSVIVPSQREAIRTKAAILKAAVELFAVRGYSDTSIRAIAGRADVNSALVGRYFGTKEQLFSIALEHCMEISRILGLDRATYGRVVVDRFLRNTEFYNPLTMMILSSSDPAARSISIDMIQKLIIAPLVNLIGGANAEARAMQLNMLWNGFFTSWLILPLPGLSGTNMDVIAEWLATTIQAAIDG